MPFYTNKAAIFHFFLCIQGSYLLQVVCCHGCFCCFCFSVLFNFCIWDKSAAILNLEPSCRLDRFRENKRHGASPLISRWREVESVFSLMMSRKWTLSLIATLCTITQCHKLLPCEASKKWSL